MPVIDACCFADFYFLDVPKGPCNFGLLNNNCTIRSVDLSSWYFCSFHLLVRYILLSDDKILMCQFMLFWLHWYYTIIVFDSWWYFRLWLKMIVQLFMLVWML